MSIHTVAPAKTTYVRIVRTLYGGDNTTQFVGRVGIMTGFSKINQLVFVSIDGDKLVFNKVNTQKISKKEYFKGLLKQ